MFQLGRVYGLAARAVNEDRDREIIERSLYRGLKLTRKQKKQRAEELETLGIIVQIPGKAKIDWDEGLQRSVVFRVDHSDVNRPKDNFDYDVCDPRWLKGVARRVFLWCKRPDPYDRSFSLKPRLVHTWGEPGATWYNLEISLD